MKGLRTLVVTGAMAVAGDWLCAQPVPVPGGEPPVKPDKTVKAKPLGGEWEVLFSDDSKMKLTLLDEQIVVETPHGSLTIPARDIRKIEFGVRLSSEDQLAFDRAIAGIAGKDAKAREEGKAALKALGGKIVPFLKRALRTADAESRPHLEQVYETIAGDHAARKLEPRDFDAITTDDSQFAGRIALSQFRVGTFQFGELKLRIADCKALQFGGISPGFDEKLEIVETQYIYQLMQTHMGKTVGIKVTGSVSGTVWGSGPFTADSSLGTAAVFAGAVKDGETKIVRVKLVADPGSYPSGAYEIIVK
jgi:hypothetical protein